MFVRIFLVSAQLESLYVCISLDYLMTLQDFFISGLPIWWWKVMKRRSRTATMNGDKQLSDKSDQLDSEKNRIKSRSTISSTFGCNAETSNYQNVFHFQKNILYTNRIPFSFNSSIIIQSLILQVETRS